MSTSNMPTDWDDHHGWEHHYSALLSSPSEYSQYTDSAGSFSFPKLGELMRTLRTQHSTTLWFPGCGVSPLPRLFALCGFDVYATDISPTALSFQRQNTTFVQEKAKTFLTAQSAPHKGTLHVERHDFREAYGHHRFDAIFNIRAIQGLPPQSMKRALHTHYDALRMGKTVYFDTMNVDGAPRIQFEELLLMVGFHVPLVALNRWYHTALKETGLAYVFVMGRPMLWQVEGEEENKRGSAQLRALTKEYEARAQVERKKERMQLDIDDKIAHIIYATG
ncbi:MAG: hypothetical protein CL920_01545 [Deltaproteobacteria bacterium]|nr:hypothetical protein [Deltaproteobacteria bacterium]